MLRAAKIALTVLLLAVVLAITIAPSVNLPLAIVASVLVFLLFYPLWWVKPIPVQVNEPALVVFGVCLGRAGPLASSPVLNC